MRVSGLTVGRNTIEVEAVAEDGLMTESYSVVVIRQEPSNDTTLDGVTLLEGPAGIFGLDLLTSKGGGLLRPSFNRNIKVYDASVPWNVTGATRRARNTTRYSGHRAARTFSSS